MALLYFISLDHNCSVKIAFFALLYMALLYFISKRVFFLSNATQHQGQGYHQPRTFDSWGGQMSGRPAGEAWH
jgi:hypothetical protein